MRRIRSKDTSLELFIRRLIFKMGFRYRLYDKNLPGKPDLVFAGRKKVIFVHGCFWHQHKNCKDAHYPKTNIEYWGPKLQKNIIRDVGNQENLKRMGWSFLVLWGCQLKNPDRLAKVIIKFLS